MQGGSADIFNEGNADQTKKADRQFACEEQLWGVCRKTMSQHPAHQGANAQAEHEKRNGNRHTLDIDAECREESPLPDDLVNECGKTRKEKKEAKPLEGSGCTVTEIPVQQRIDDDS